jgi:hypothetical protein
MSTVKDNCIFGAGKNGNGQCFNVIDCKTTLYGISHICDHDRNCHFACKKKSN